MNLNETLVQIAADFNLDAKQLIDYAIEDTQTGWDEDKGAWPVGSLWGVEGQILYALVRFTKPKRLLELGTLYGCSATHILMAMARNDNGATLTAIDSGLHVEGGVAGGMIPSRLKHMMTLHRTQISEWIKSDKTGYDFVFEDAKHDSPSVFRVWEVRNNLVNPGGFLISHDAKHHLVGSQVMRGITQAGAIAKAYLTEPSDCGMALWQREDAPTDYNLIAYDTLWAKTGPKDKNMRAWIRETTGKKAKPTRTKLVELINEWDGMQSK